MKLTRRVLPGTCLCVLGLMMGVVMPAAGSDVEIQNDTAYRLKVYVKQQYETAGQSTIHRGEVNPGCTVSASTSTRLGRIASISVIAQKLTGNTIDRKYECATRLASGGTTRLAISEGDRTYP